MHPAPPPTFFCALRALFCTCLLLSLTVVSHATESWWGGGSYGPTGYAEAPNSPVNPYGMLTGDSGSASLAPIGNTATSLAPNGLLNIANIYPATHQIGLWLKSNSVANESIRTQNGTTSLRFHINGGSALAGEPRQVRRVSLQIEAQAYASVSFAGTGTTDVSSQVTFTDSDLLGFEARAGVLYPTSSVWGRGPYRERRTDNPSVQKRLVTRDVEFDENGVGEMVIKFDMTCANRVNFSPNYGGDEETWVSVRLSQNFVLIESPTIEDSFYKGTVDLPPFFIPGTPQLNQRLSDGSIYTDSVVEWDNGWGRFFGGGSFAARQNGYGTPSFHWSFSGDGTLTEGARAEIDSNKQQITLTDGRMNVPGIDFGTESTGFPKNSNIIVFVMDANNAANPILTNNFSVKWHLPYENWQQQGADVPTSPEPVTLTEPNGATKTRGGVPLQYSYDITKVDFSFSETELSIGSAVIGGVGAIVAFAGSGGIGAALGLVSSVMGVGSAVIGAAPPAPVYPLNPSYTSYAAYKDAVQQQETVGDYPDGQPRFAPANMINIVKATFPNGDANGLGDTTWQYNIYEEGKASFDRIQRHWVGDKYGVHGYTGPTEGDTTHRSNTPVVQITWSYDADSPGPGG